MLSRMKKAAWVLAFLLGACAAPEPPRGEPLFISGRVLDQETMQPIEGAFVLASYAVRVPGRVANATQCVKTMGMHTAADGEFRFPVERPDNLSPATISAIKYGYRRGDVHGRDIRLLRQSRDEPVFRYGYGGEAFCVEAATSADAAAGMRFLELQRDEMVEYGADAGQVRGIEVMIRLLKGIDARNPR